MSKSRSTLRFSRSTPLPLRCFVNEVVKDVGWEKAAKGIELRFVEKPGYTQHGPAMVGDVVYMMRPGWWRGIGSGALARTVVHELQHALDRRSGDLYTFTSEQAEARAETTARQVSDSTARRIASACGLKIDD